MAVKQHLPVYTVCANITLKRQTELQKEKVKLTPWLPQVCPIKTYLPHSDQTAWIESRMKCRKSQMSNYMIHDL